MANTICSCRFSFVHMLIVSFHGYLGFCVAFHRGIQISIDRHFGDSDVNIETFGASCFYLHVLACFYQPEKLGFIGCFQHFMHICHARYYSTLSQECALLEEKERE